MEKMIGRLKQIEEDLDRLKSLEASGHIIEGTSRKVNRKSETVHVFLLQLLSLPGADLRLAFGGLISGSVPVPTRTIPGQRRQTHPSVTPVEIPRSTIERPLQCPVPPAQSLVLSSRNS